MRAKVMGVSGVITSLPDAPFSAGCFLWGADTRPFLGTSLPSPAEGGSHFQGSPHVLVFASIPGIPLGSS